MPAWPGGGCPQCGEFMPEKLIHCQNCRALLNSDLESDSVEIPEFIPLKEIATMVDVELNGYYIGCPICQKELRIHRKYVGKEVQCKHCAGQFPFVLTDSRIRTVAFYAQCPHCSKELRAQTKYLGAKVACKHCSGKIQLIGTKKDVNS
ncbi:MAG: hypothetical protein IID45_01335 [Planctomycetes bacterium]|nr:hypothetical protein [Planctomycetota bacterium]